MTNALRPSLAALLVLPPLVWSFGSENSALVKWLAAGAVAGAAVAAGGLGGLRRALRGAAPCHLLATLALASAAVSPSPSFAAVPALQVLTLWLVAGLAAAAAAPAAWWRGAAVAAVALPAAHGALQAAGLDPTGWMPVVRDHFHGRICGPLGNPNFYAAWLAGLLPLASLAHPLLGAAAAGLVLLTGSKAGLLGLAAAGAAGLAAARRAGWLGGGLRGRIPAARAVAAAAIVLIALVSMPPTVRQRLLFNPPAEASDSGIFALTRNESIRFRVLTWTQTLRMIREAPIAGHGLGRYQVEYPKWRLPEIIRMFGQHSYITDHPENLTLEIAAELGLPGTGLWLWLLAAAAARLWGRLRHPDPSEQRLAAAALAGLAALAATNSAGLDAHYGATAVLGAALAGLAFGPRPRRASPPAEPVAAPAARLRLRPAPAAAGIALGLAWIRVCGSDAALIRAMQASAAGAWEPALRRYDEALRLNPFNVMARYFGGSAHLDRRAPGDLEAARRRFDSVRREAPDYVLLNYKYWLLYNALGLTREANEALARQIELDPVAPLFRLERGRRAMEEGRLDDAERDFAAAARDAPHDPSGFQFLGNLLVVRGRYAEALRAYDRGLARHPDSIELHFNAAVAALRAGDRARARRHAQAVLARSPGHAGAQLILARTR